MRAIAIERFGGPEVLRWIEVEEPRLPAGEVLVDVVAAGVNRADVMQREGNYPPPAGAPPYPGLEISGRIAALGAGVSGWSVGDPVCALVGGGGYAERIAVPVAQLLPVPVGVSIVEAAALPEAACTVTLGLFTLAKLQPGESVFVNGGSSGIGTMAIQLAKAAGARVFATAGIPEKIEQCRALGADVGINYRNEDFAERIRAETEGRGVDVIVDLVGGSALDANVRSLATKGRLVAVGIVNGAIGQVNLIELITRRRAILTLSLRRMAPDEKADVVRSVRERVWPFIDAGKVRPVVDRRVPLRDAAQAHRVMEAGEHFGKIVLVTADTDVAAV
jgi:putative PIG3 family NAD(P)H quinone oxidoreductase